MKLLTIEAEQIKIGDQIQDHGSYCGYSFPVSTINKPQSGSNIEVVCGKSLHPIIDTRTKYIMHYRQGLRVYRPEAIKQEKGGVNE